MSNPIQGETRSEIQEKIEKARKANLAAGWQPTEAAERQLRKRITNQETLTSNASIPLSERPGGNRLGGGCIKA